MSAAPISYLLEFDSELEEREALIELNRQRDKTFSQKMREAEEIEEIYRKKHSDSQGERTDLKENETSDKNLSKVGRTDRDVAKQIGIGSRETYRKAKKVWNKAEEGDEKATFLDASFLKVRKKVEKKGISTEVTSIENLDFNTFS